MSSATNDRTAVWSALAVLALLAAFPAAAQQRRSPARAVGALPADDVAGRVVDASTGRAVDGARVAVVELARAAVTDDDGRFRGA